MANDTELVCEEDKKKELSYPSYSVDALMEKLGITANVKIWETINNIVYVQGVAHNIKYYKNIVYFELKGSNNTLTIKCPVELAPNEGEHLIIEGMPIMRPSRFC